MHIVAQFIRLETAKIPLKALGETLWPYRAKNVAVLKKFAACPRCMGEPPCRARQNPAGRSPAGL
jgi:hypothetical protein